MVELDRIAGGCRHGLLRSSEEIQSESHPLFAIKQLVEQIEDVWNGTGILPSHLRDSVTMAYPRQFRYDHLFDDTGRRDELGESLGLEELQRFERAIRYCIERQLSEPGWNQKVHHPMIERAVALSQYGSSLEVAVM